MSALTTRAWQTVLKLPLPEVFLNLLWGPERWPSVDERVTVVARPSVAPADQDWAHRHVSANRPIAWRPSRAPRCPRA
eukprot:8121907-Alexandrium_andersonii.AAC.1